MAAGRDFRKAYYLAVGGPVADVKTALDEAFQEDAVDRDRLARVARLYRLPAASRPRAWLVLLGTRAVRRGKEGRGPAARRGRTLTRTPRHWRSAWCAGGAGGRSADLSTWSDVAAQQQQEAADLRAALPLLYRPDELQSPGQRLLAMALIKFGCVRDLDTVRAAAATPVYAWRVAT